MKRILLVDDDPNFLDGLVRRLRPMREAWTIATAGNGVEALELQSRAPFDVVVTDLLMPDKEGLQTIMELRRDHPGTGIIAMSGGSRRCSMDFLGVAKELGAHQTLAKPFDVSMLIEAVQELLRQP